MLQPANDATPATAGTGIGVGARQCRTGRLEGWVIVNVTELVLAVVTVLPPRSWIATCGLRRERRRSWSRRSAAW